LNWFFVYFFRMGVNMDCIEVKAWFFGNWPIEFEKEYHAVRDKLMKDALDPVELPKSRAGWNGRLDWMFQQGFAHAMKSYDRIKAAAEAAALNPCPRACDDIRQKANTLLSRTFACEDMIAATPSIKLWVVISEAVDSSGTVDPAIVDLLSSALGKIGCAVTSKSVSEVVFEGNGLRFAVRSDSNASVPLDESIGLWIDDGVNPKVRAHAKFRDDLANAKTIVTKDWRDIYG
jgi:hypothetical protein